MCRDACETTSPGCYLTIREANTEERVLIQGVRCQFFSQLSNKGQVDLSLIHDDLAQVHISHFGRHGVEGIFHQGIFYELK